jgi:predicted DCC family thiol-disulfide oxidoreductase YuxK
MPDKSIIFFDGVCNLCNGFVNFIIPRDQKNRFQFSSLQSAKAQIILKDYHYFIDDISTVILLEDGQLFTQSTAVLKIVRKMSGLWPLLYAFIIIPKPIRDFLYKRIANNRYRLFGKRDSCRMPSPELKSKFLE